MEAKLIFCGDTCFRHQHDIGETESEAILSDVMPELKNADLRIMNLESPLAPAEIGSPIRKAGPNLTGRPKNIGFLRAAGCDLALMANNHAVDFGVDSMHYTESLLSENNIAHIGTGENLENAYRAFRRSINGISVSVISVCEHEFGIAGIDSPGTAGYDEYLMAETIRGEKKVSDYVIVAFHGGNEHNPLPSPRCQTRYRTIIMLGADAVIAGHTHCPQGFELCHGKPIFYSLGNFLFKENQEYPLAWYYGYMVRLKLGQEISYDIIPYRFEPDGSRINLLRGKEREDMLAYIDRLSSIISDWRELANYYDGWCFKTGGAHWANGAVTPEYADISKQPANFPCYYDVFTCEAHNEMVTNGLRMYFEGNLDKGRKYAEKISELQIK